MTSLNDTVTVTLHHSHDPEIIHETLDRYPDVTFLISSPDPRLTQLQGSYRSIINILLDYYYWEDTDIVTNHPHIDRRLLDLFRNG